MYVLLLFRHIPLGVRSAICRHQPPQRAVLSQIDSFVQCEVVGSQFSLDGVQPRDTGTPCGLFQFSGGQQLGSTWHLHHHYLDYFNHFMTLFRDHPGELVPKENLWTLWCKGRLIEADTSTIRLGATPSRLTSAHLHHPHFLQARCPSCHPTNSVKALKATSAFGLWRRC